MHLHHDELTRYCTCPSLLPILHDSVVSSAVGGHLAVTFLSDYSIVPTYLTYI